jgi:DNA processing protein
MFMTFETALAWSWLNVLTKKRHDALREVYGGLDEALGDVGEHLLKSLGCREETIMKVLLRWEEYDAEGHARELERRGIRLVTIDDERYPEQLRHIGDPPVFLFFRGDIGVLDQPCIGLVGTRTMSAYGKRVAERFVPAMVRAGAVTVSGLALGIDACVALETMAAGGRTVAVLGHGLGAIHPKSNARIAERIIESGGLLLTEFPLDIAPDKYTFPARNRIIAGLSLGTVVLEAPEGSGAVITAALALEYGRDVFAAPGQIFDENYRGCHALIAKGQAKLVSSPDEVLADIGIVSGGRSDGGVPTSYEPQNDVEAALLRVLTTMPQRVDDIIGRSRLEPAGVNAALTMMELQGAVKNVGGGQWVKI